MQSSLAIPVLAVPSLTPDAIQCVWNLAVSRTSVEKVCELTVVAVTGISIIERAQV